MDLEKVTSKINEVNSKVEDRFLKHELQMQLMVENMEGIMQMIAHKLDSLEKKGLHHGDQKEEVNQRWKLPTFDGTSKWGPYAKQAGVIFEMNNCTDPKWRALKIIEGLRGKAMAYFNIF